MPRTLRADGGPEPAAAGPPRAADGAPRWYAHAYNRAAYYRLARAAAPRLPRRARSWLAAGAGRLLGGRFDAERAAVRRNLGRVHPDRDATSLDRATGRVFANFAVCFADLLSLNRTPADRLWRHVAGFAGRANSEAALAAERGCVFVTAHLGNWELAGRLLASFGRRVHVVMSPEQDPDVARLLHGGATGAVRFVRRRSPLVSVELVAALRRGERAAFQVDRATGERGDCRLSFFGAPVPFPIGPFVLAAAAGVEVVPAFCVLEPSGAYRLAVEPAFPVARGEEATGLVRAVSVLERYVRAHSDQWFNFFDVWERDDGR